MIGDRNAEVPEENRVAYRIGINIGDIVVEDDDIYGDGVNVAARLEGLAELNGICVARNVFDQVKDKLDLTIEHLGEREVKNIAEPVTVYRVVLDDKAAALVTPVVHEATTPVHRRWMVAAAATLVAAIGGVSWWQPWAPDVEPASVEKMALPLPDKPSIAVLPFENMSGDPEQAYFADGMTDDLITDLSKISELFVISRNSTFTYKGKPVKVRQVAEELGVRYVLEGSVRRADDEVRINAQLIDATTGGHVWAERYDGTLTNIFDLQDRVIGQIVTALAVNLTSQESARKAQAETAVPQAYDALLQGWDHYRRQTPEDYAKAIPFFEKAIELDPGYSRAYAGLATVYWGIADLSWHTAAGIEATHAVDRAKENFAKALEHPTSDAYGVSAEMLLVQGRNDEALAEIDRALALAPNDAGNHSRRAWILTISGRAEEAEADARLAMRLNPRYQPSYLRVLGRALFYQERYEEAAETLERAASRQPDYENNYPLVAAAYGHLGRIEDAKAAVGKYNVMVAKTIGSPLTLEQIETWLGGGWYDYDKTYLAQLIEGLRKAGVPEGAAAEMTDVDYRDLVVKSAGIFDVEGAVKIDAAGAKAVFDRGVVFIDSRSSGPYSRGHIPNAINLYTGTSLTKAALSEHVGLDEEVVFYCGGEDCPLSANACAKALVWGYTKVYYLA
jgi:TolB-like protein/rhodanese-related sulfurtransferase